MNIDTSFFKKIKDFVKKNVKTSSNSVSISQVSL